jgi:putative phosphoribosyl transferase
MEPAGSGNVMAVTAQIPNLSCAIPQPSGEVLRGDLSVPPSCIGLVVFAHGSGSSRLSPRNRSVADHLESCGLGTLLIDLLTDEEQERDRFTGEHRFDIDRLADRVAHTLDWLQDEPEEVARLPLGCFGASTGAAAALVAAAQRPERVRAVVSRGGRPDLAEAVLERVMAPTLLLVGGADHEVLRLSRQAAARLTDGELRVVTGATHLFQEPGALEQVQALSADWFSRHLPLAG